MNRDERSHLEQLVGVYNENIRHLELQVAMRGGTLNAELELHNTLKHQRTELAAVRRRLARATPTTPMHPTELLSAYLQEPSLNKRQRMMVTLLLGLLEQSDG